ncbi:DcaP family trimeric outer membrane transporter [Marinobacter sp. F4218]|uniref:DcaP family trimeric outer membrane transporter n=1 Tax=Marinobacter sp. F4218 TaxID=2862868 RepID=UPI001C62A017|nr:DcaP family trimeric outer membrane transporter [Marinobacter sp. F4218]MBW7471987.1 porin [Marinobacter sp. F4218]
MTTRTPFKPRPLTRAMALASLPLITFASAGVSAQSNAELDQLRERVQMLESKLEGAVSTAPEASEDNPYILREGDGLKIGGTTISFGGFIKADMMYGSNGNGQRNTYSVGLPRTFASAAATDNDWKVGFSARESRFSFGTSTEGVAGHQLRTYLEMDFQQGIGAPGNEVVSNSYSPRLRQAYGNWNGWEFGQTYTTFTDLAAMPEILNQGKQAAFIYVTQPMIRYNMAVPGGKLMMALENPEDGFGTNSYDDQSYPDLTARYQVRGKHGFYSVAGLLRNLEDDASGESELAGAVSVSARIPTIGKDDIRLQYSYGALGRYMGLFTYPDVDLVAQAGGEVKALDTYGATAAYRHFWSPAWRSTVTVSHTEIVDDLTAPPAGTLSYFDSSTSAHVNLLWSAHSNLTLGLEYAYWDFGEIAGSGSNQYEQVMASAKLSF